MRAGIRKRNAPNAYISSQCYALPFLPLGQDRTEYDLFYKIKTAKKSAAKLAPIAMLFLPAELVVCCVGVLLAWMVLFEMPLAP